MKFTNTIIDVDQHAPSVQARGEISRGFRIVTQYKVFDEMSLMRFIALHDKAAMTAFIDAWAQRNHKEYRNADGLRVWTKQEEF